MSKIKQLWTLLWFQLAITPGVVFLAVASGFPCIIEFVLFRDTKVPTSLDLLLSSQMISLVLVFGPNLLAPDLGSSGKINSLGASATATEFLLTRAVDRHLLFRSRSLLFFFLLLIIPLISLATSLHHPDLKIFESNSSLYHRVMQALPGSIPEAPDIDGKLKEVFVRNGNILIGMWRIWLPLCLGVIILVFLTLARKIKYVWRLFMPLVTALIIFYCYPSVFFRGASDAGKDGLDLNTALFFFFATHQLFCWLIAIPALFQSLLWYERDNDWIK